MARFVYNLGNVIPTSNSGRAAQMEHGVMGGAAAMTGGSTRRARLQSLLWRAVLNVVVERVRVDVFVLVRA